MDESSKKKRYCKLCGNEIDPVTKKCSGCGKQYFTIKKKTLVFLLTLSLIGNVLIGVFAFYNYRVYNTQYHEWLSERNELALKIRECSEKADVLDENVVFVTESGDRFHSYGCQYIRGKSTTHWFVEDAIREGYLPCSVCREENMFWIQ